MFDFVREQSFGIFPAGCKIGSHSWREMGCVASYLARYDSLRMANHGFWRDVQTTWQLYIYFINTCCHSPPRETYLGVSRLAVVG
eukprot:SAG31_NODE_28974_length_402_cov_2.937294_1_plen_84_part_01